MEFAAVRKNIVRITKMSELQQGDRIVGTLTNGESICFEVAKKNESSILLVCTHTLGIDIQWNKAGNTTGGYPKSYIRKWLNEEFVEMLPEDFKDLLIADKHTGDSVRLLTREEIFGENCLDMMKNHNNRIALRGFNGNYSDWYWLQDVASSSNACYVAGYGDSNHASASGAFGVRPTCLVRS